MAEATYFCGVTSSTIGSNKFHLALMNSGGSGRMMKIYLIQACGAPTAATTGWMVPLHAFRMSTNIVGGTTLTIYNASTGQSTVIATTAIAVNASATAFALEASPFGVGAVSGEETVSGGVTNLYEFQMTGLRALLVAPGSGVVVRQGAGTGSGEVSVMVWFSLI